MLMLPDSGDSNPAIADSSVVLPQPLGPWSRTSSPGATSRSSMSRCRGRAGLVDEVVQSEPGPADDRACPGGAELFGESLGAIGDLRRGHGERDQPYVVVGTEVEDLFLGKVCPEVLDDPVVVAERHRRHGGRQPVTISGD